MARVPGKEALLGNLARCQASASCARSKRCRRCLLPSACIRTSCRCEPATTDEKAETIRRRVLSFLREPPESAKAAEEYDLPNFLSEWLSFYGPVEKEELVHLLGITPERLDEAIEPLIEAQDLVMDRFGEESRGLEICDSGNLEDASAHGAALSPAVVRGTSAGAAPAVPCRLSGHHPAGRIHGRPPAEAGAALRMARTCRGLGGIHPALPACSSTGASGSTRS